MFASDAETELNINENAGPLYPKIPGPFKRYTDGPLRGKLIESDWSSPELRITAGLPWQFTEKLDGTNIRIHWDGHRVIFGGRTDRAEMPAPITEYLEATFLEELLELKFGETPVTIYGEAIGRKIQKVGHFYGDVHVRIFDVLIGGMWLLRPNVEDVAKSLGVEAAPLVGTDSSLYWAIDKVQSGLMSEVSVSELVAEGLVGTLESGLLDRRGNRIIVKIKTRDFS